MKKSFAFVLVAVLALGAMFALAACDGNGLIIPSNNWSFDDDYHWHTEEDKALHTVENGVCTVCKTPVDHTVGLEYQLVTPEPQTLRASAKRTTALHAPISPLADLEYESNGSYYVVTGLDESLTGAIDLVIPATYNGIPVKEIGEKAFEYYRKTFNRTTYITSVVLPEGLERIDDSAFSCTGISSLTIPSTVTFIGEYAFHVTDIVSVVIPKTVELSYYSFTSPTVVYSEWTSEEHKEIDKENAYYAGAAVYYYREDFSQVPAGEHCWHYENGEIVEYSNWLGVSESSYVMFNYYDGSVFWQMAEPELILTVKSAEGNDVELSMVLAHHWWEAPDINSQEHIDYTNVVFDENGEFRYKTHILYYQIPADFNGNSFPLPDWEATEYEVELIIERPETRYAQGKIFVDLKMRLEPLEACPPYVPGGSYAPWYMELF